MKYLLIYILGLISLQSLQSQTGFSTPFDLDSPGIGILSLSNSGDTILAFGQIFHKTIPNYIGLFFAKIDTNGHVISINTFYDPLGGNYTAKRHCRIAKRKDSSGYIVPAMSFDRSTGILCFINQEGVFTKVIEYPDSNSLVDFYKDVVVYGDGFLILGEKQHNDYSEDVFLMKTDLEGNKIWEKSIDGPGRQWGYSGSTVENDNSIILSIQTSELQGTPLALYTFQTIFLAVDSLVNEKWRWEGPIGLNDAGGGALLKRPDGNWMYIEQDVRLFPFQNYTTKTTKIVVRDPDFNLVWQKTVSPSYSELNGLSEIQATPDGNWVAVGALTTAPIEPLPNALAGWMFKFTNEGDMIWDRMDTVFYNTVTYTDHYLYGLVQLPSGSIIAAGYINVYYPTTKSWAWIIKINKDGCIDTLNCATLPAMEPLKQADADLMIYPNPTYSTVQYTQQAAFDWDKIEVFGMDGKLYKMIQKSPDREIDLSPYPSGFYLIKFSKSNRYITRKVMKE